MPLIAISGSQGSGKSTATNRLRDRGFKIIERKTSRSILEEWNVSLSEVNNDRNLTIRFQNEIVMRKWQDEQYAVQSNEVYITERTYADLFTYALVSVGKDNDYSSWLTEYYHKCISAQQTYSMVYYLKAGHFAPEDDGVRGIGIHYSRMIDLVMNDITTQMTVPHKLNSIATPCLDQRVAIIESQIRCL